MLQFLVFFMVFCKYFYFIYLFIYFCKKERLNTNSKTELQKIFNKVESNNMKERVWKVTRMEIYLKRKSALFA